MRLALRFILPLLTILALIAYASIPLFESLNLRWAVRDLDARAGLIAATMKEPLTELVVSKSRAKIEQLFANAVQDERLFAVAVCDPAGQMTVRTGYLPEKLKCASSEGDTSLKDLHVSRHNLQNGDERVGQLILVHDMSFLDRRSSDTRRYFFFLFIIVGLVISVVTVLIAQLSVRRLLGNIRRVLRSRGPMRPLSQWRSPELLPLAKDLRNFLRDVGDRGTRDESQITWSPKTLKDILKQELAGDEVLTVSNREPYIHVHRKGKIEVQFPASGLVTALEPIMRACSGTWIAHGSGSADKEAVDAFDRVQVPPGNPSYQIRRVWLSKEQEQGYYYGFSNEGLWPLCHMAYTRPEFRSSDWQHYVDVNRKFAEVVVQEARTEDPVVLVQDYHLALLPRMIRDRLPKATVITFWHIPWPNPEAFGICPWREEIVDGLLGSSILGFHTRFHCNNFIDTVDRLLEARIDRETSTISFGGSLTAIKSYPISIEWPVRFASGDVETAADSRREVRKENGLPENILLGIGVDRLDYTKGIVERLLAVERLIERRPEWIGRFTFIQIAAPSRSSIEQYQNFEQQVRSVAARINDRFGKPGYQPIMLKIEHHEPQEVFTYFRACDVCMVTSLHDGMNLVAKEFVAARDDEQGVLVLSQFTGASRELQEALIVNPYNIDQCATALHLALSMPVEEQRTRMHSMRSLIQEFNVYRWAGRMLMDAARMRQHLRLKRSMRETEQTL